MIDTNRDSIRARLLETFTYSGQPMATIYLPPDSAVADAAHPHDVGVGRVLKELAEMGVSDEFESVVGDALADLDHGDGAGLALGAGFALVATPSQVLLAQETHGSSTKPLCSVGRTPELLPLLLEAQSDIEYLAAPELRDAIATGRGVQGNEVLDLLNQGRIERLYAANDTFDTHRPIAGFGFSPPSAAPRATAGPIQTTAPVTEGAVALAVVAGADVVVVPGTGTAGFNAPIAGILRGERP